MDKPKLTNCSPDDVLKLFKKLGGFEVIKSGAKHYGIKHTKTGIKTTVPRKVPVNRYLLKQDIVENFLIKELGYSEKEIFKHLWC